MQTWIALLRGINVGGNNILPMKDLRTLLEGLGFDRVKTYIQSGNCVFTAEASDRGEISEQIASRIEIQFGFTPAVLIISVYELRAALEANPYPEGLDDPKSVHFFFLSEPATEADLAALSALKSATEAYTLTETIFYLRAPDGIGRSKLAAQAEKKLGVATTARNLRTVLKLLELAG